MGRKNRTMPNLRRQLLRDRGEKCELCGSGGKIHLHHKNAVCLYPSMRKDKDNIVLLCEECHHTFHRDYGVKVTERDYNEFLYNRKYDLWHNK